MKKTMCVYAMLQKGFSIYSSEYKEDAVETMNYLTNNGENSEEFKLITEEINKEDL